LKSGDFGTLFSQNIPLYELALDLVFFFGGEVVKICPQKKLNRQLIRN
jgi:hypothetical protein